jgi:DNA-binding transcriptional regulator GbsR (MarR family)
MVLKNLTSEIKVLLEEEAVRSVRKAEEIKVEYKMKIGESDDNSNLESEVFEIKNTLDDLTKLPTKILSYFNSLPSFSEAEIHFTELAFTLKKFVPL